jgi:hypothetical protein
VSPLTYVGVGMLVSTTPKPLIVTSRAVVQTSVCDIFITIGKRNIPAKILHLGHVVVLTVDTLLAPIPMPTISSKEYIVGEAVEVFGLNFQHQVVQRRTEISGIAPLTSAEHAVPAWRFINTEGYALLDTPKILSGVIIDPSDSSIIALWIEVNLANGKGWLGLDYRYYVQPIIEALEKGETYQEWCSGCVFEQLHLSRALELGLPEHYATVIDEIAHSLGTGPQVVWVLDKFRHWTSELEIGDFILEIDDEPVGRIADIRRFAQTERTKTLIFRDRKLKEIQVRSREMSSQGPSLIVCWAGAICQPTPQFVLEKLTAQFVQVSEREQINNIEELVYISSCLPGSPSSGVIAATPPMWILEIAGTKLRSLQDLLQLIPNLKARESEYIPVKVIGQRGVIQSVGMKLNSAFWPAWTLERKKGDWVRTELN